VATTSANETDRSSEGSIGELAIWRAERAIGRVIQSYARGIDRQDFDRVRSCFHADAHIEYGDWFSGGLEAAISWLATSLPRLDGTLHVFGPPWIELDLDSSRATCETYAINSARYLPDEDGIVIQNSSGTRYSDRFECREGVWAIVWRRNERAWTRNDATHPDPPLPDAPR
jgi:hypothetical protein